MDKIKFAVIGCGHIGKRHIEMITRNQESKLVALCDIKDPVELNLTNYSAPFFYDIDKLLDSEIEMDVVVIATPSGLHTEHSNKALNKKKHIVCEKPLGLSKLSVESVLHSALQVSKNVFAVMQNRYSPPSVWIKNVIDQRLLGEIFMVQVNCFWNRDNRYYKKGSWKGTHKYDGGTLYTQFSHFIDIMFWLFGDIKNINGIFKDFSHKDLTDFEDSGIVYFDFIKEGIGSLNYSTSVWEQNLESSITILGKKGRVKIGGQYMNEVIDCRIEDYTMPQLEKSNPANDYGGYKGSAANHHYIIKNVVDTLKGRSTITTNALEGLKVVEIIEEIYRVRDRSFKKKKSAGS